MNLWNRLRQELAHAFAMTPSAGPLHPEDLALLEKIAAFIAKREMATPSLLFLESVGPLSFLGSQVVHGLKPFLDLVCNPLELERLATILERREGLDQLIFCIHEHTNRSA